MPENSDSRLSPVNILNRSYDPTFDVLVSAPVRRTEAGTALEHYRPASETKQDAIVAAIENITIPAPAGGATEAKQDAIITALGNVKIDTGDIDLNTDGLETIGTATNTKLDTQIVNQETLLSLIETLQELNQRLAPLAGTVANTAQLRVIGSVAVTSAPSTAVTGPITSANSIAEKAVAGVLYPEKIAITNLTAHQTNIINVTA